MADPEIPEQWIQVPMSLVQTTLPPRTGLRLGNKRPLRRTANKKEAELDDLNDYNRTLYRDEVAGLIDRLIMY